MSDYPTSPSLPSPRTTHLLQLTDKIPHPPARQSSSEFGARKLTLMQLVHSISAILQSSKDGKKDLESIRTLLLNYDASLNEWRRYVTTNPQKQYTRNLIATDQKTFTLMLLCWNPKSKSMIHAHASSECFMRVLQGEIIETQYENLTPCEALKRAQGEEAVLSPICIENVCLKVKQAIKFSTGQITFINDSIGLHKVENPSEELACTLHCYIPPYDRSLCYEVFEKGKGISIKTGFVSFDSENGEKFESD